MRNRYEKIVQTAIRDLLGEFIKEFAHFNDNVLLIECINNPSGVKHWHGASKDSWFLHLAIEVPGDNLSTERLDKVNDEEYDKLK